MLSEVTNHLWQSTVFAVAAGLITLGFRNNRAQVRHWLWFCASCKFLLPLSLLLSVGSRFPWASVSRTPASTAAVQFAFAPVSRPFSSEASYAPPLTGTGNSVVLAIVSLWACGFLAVVVLRVRDWRRIRTAVRSSTPLPIPAPIEIRSSPGLLEPGVVGLFRPLLLLPSGIVQRLTPPQWEAILEHELCHVRRRDNLTSATHMVVEAVFWFHPLVWWIGARLVEERERACDEAVVQLGRGRRDYAEAILNVCKTYVESPLPCVSGVTGSPLRKRIEAILAGCVVRDLTWAKKVFLGAGAIAAIGVPVTIGMVRQPSLRAQPAALTPGFETARFETASIRPCTAFRKNTPQSWSPGAFHSQCTTVERLIEQAFGLFVTGHMNAGSDLTVAGGPAWVTSDFYEVEAQPENPQGHSVMNGPMLQAFLADKLALQVHRETRDIPVYRLTVADGGPKLEPFHGTCKERDFNQPPSGGDCGTASGFGPGFRLKAATMADLCAGFSVLLNRRVVDQTGLAGRFNLRLDLSTVNTRLLNRPRSLPALSDPLSPAPPPLVFPPVQRALKELGLNLEPGNGPGEFLVIDRVQKAAAN